MTENLLGDEAVALGAIHAGLTAAYAYPGTPSTEILEYLIAYQQQHKQPHAAWCSNEKTSYEEALGVSFAGRRSLVAMKHVGLNVAADPFINSAIVSINGGLVVVVADDPGMHSSQNEQDSRYYSDLAHIICLEPIASDLISFGAASIILSMEPLEGLRYLNYLSSDGMLVTSTNPTTNITDYPEMSELLEQIKRTPHHVLLDSDKLAKQSGSARATNMVMVGAASHSLPVKTETIERFITSLFSGKGEKIVNANLKAFRAGRKEAAQ